MAMITTLDDYDQIILRKTQEKEYTIMELVKEIGIAHKNLLNHLNKLEELGLITRYNPGGKVIIIKPTADNKKADMIINKDTKNLKKFLFTDKIYDKIAQHKDGINFVDMSPIYKISPLNFWLEFIVSGKYEIIIKAKQPKK